MKGYKSKGELIKDFRNADGSLNKAAVVRMATVEAAELYGVAYGTALSVQWLREMTVDMAMMFDSGNYRLLHDTLQKVYGLGQKDKELEGMYLVLENKEASELYFKMFVSAIDMMVFSSETMIAAAGVT